MSEFFWKIDVLDPQKTEIRVAVQGLCTDDRVPGEQALLNGMSGAGVQLPALFEKLLLRKGDKICLFKKVIMTAAGKAVLLIGGLPGSGFATMNISFIQRYGATLDLVMDGI